MEKQKKKLWEAPTVECLSVKDMTMTGMRRGRSRRSLKNGKDLQVEPFES